MPSAPRLALALLALSTVAAAPRPAEFPAAGVTFVPLTGWSPVVPFGKPETVARYVPPGAKAADDGHAIVLVEASHPDHSGDAKSTAAGFAKRWHCTVAPAPVKLGGTVAYRLTAPPGPALQPTAAVVAVHDGLLYLILGLGQTGDPDVRPGVDAIAATWKWVPIEPPAKHLTMDPTPVVALDGAVRFNVPAHAHAHVEDPPAKEVIVALSDLRLNRPVFLANLQTTPLPAAADWPTIEKALSDAYQQKAGMARPFKWHPVPGPTRREVSDAVPATGLGVGHPAALANAVVRLDDESALLVTFTLDATTASDVAAFGPIMDQMAASVRKP